MRRLAIPLLLLLCCGALALSAEAPLLPDQFGAWQASGATKLLRAHDLGSDLASGTTGARILQETGFSRAEERSYRSSAGEVTLRLFQMHDPSSAFELYTFLLAPGSKTLGLAEDSSVTDRDSRFLIGNLVVVASYSAKVKPEAVTGILAALKSKADPTPFPPLKNYLPTRWRNPGSQRYALGPEAFRAALNTHGQAAFADLANEIAEKSDIEAILAKFNSERESGELVLLLYPTPQVAEQHLHHLEDTFAAQVKAGGLSIERKASMLSLVLTPTSREYANALRQEVSYETTITWNEPHQTYSDPPIALILVKIILYTGAILGASVALGLAFGGFRVLIKHLFPGKVFDRPGDIEVIQMGLSGKKIDASDMY